MTATDSQIAALLTEATRREDWATVLDCQAAQLGTELVGVRGALARERCALLLATRYAGLDGASADEAIEVQP